MINKISFLGVAKPYKRNGYYIVPIQKNPSEIEVEKTIQATKKEDGNIKPARGYQGEVFALGEDLIVKHFFNKKNDGAKKAFDREVRELDLLYENKVELGSSQKGMYGVISPDGQHYLVSSRVKGRKADKTNPYTKENLTKLLEHFAKMDKGFIIKCDAENPNPMRIMADRKRKIEPRDIEQPRFLRHIYMHYDLSSPNVFVSKDDAGLLDFEWGSFEDMDALLELHVKDGHNGWSCHRSDASGLLSNLRTFESRAFYRYLIVSDNTREIFEQYLGIKSNYHQEMSAFYDDYSKENPYCKKEIEDIAFREFCHGATLGQTNLKEDVILAEAIKIQMARMMANVALGSEKINLEQLKEFMPCARNFFIQKTSNAQEYEDIALETYYQDGLKLINAWIEEFEFLIARMHVFEREKFDKIFSGVKKVTLLDKLGFSLDKYKPNIKKEIQKLNDDLKAEFIFEDDDLKYVIKTNSKEELVSLEMKCFDGNWWYFDAQAALNS